MAVSGALVVLGVPAACGSDDTSQPVSTGLDASSVTGVDETAPTSSPSTTTTSTTTTTTTTTTSTTTTPTTSTTTTTLPDRRDDPISVVFIGDSTGRVVAEGLAEVAASEGSIDLTIATRNGCGLMTTGDLLNPMSGRWEPIPAECIEQVEQVVPDVVAEQQPDVVLAMVSSWDVSQRRWSDGVESTPVDARHQERLGADYARLVERLLDVGAGEVVWLLQPTPNGFWQNVGEGQDDDRWQEASRQVVRALADTAPRTEVLDLVAWMDTNDVLDDVATRPDGIHFAPEAAVEVGHWIRHELLVRSAPVDAPDAD